MQGLSLLSFLPPLLNVFLIMSRTFVPPQVEVDPSAEKDIDVAYDGPRHVLQTKPPPAPEYLQGYTAFLLPPAVGPALAGRPPAGE